jgi:hypothetical protein
MENAMDKKGQISSDMRGGLEKVWCTLVTPKMDGIGRNEFYIMETFT